MRKIALSAVILLAFSAAAFGQCSFTVNPSGTAYADSLGYLDTGYDPLVIQVTASSQTCAWTADPSDGFASVSSGLSGTGNGSVTYTVAPNTTNLARTVVLHIAGNAITLTQQATASTFVDVPVNDLFFDAINLMRSNSITSGCSASPLTYCENSNVTRDQMAVFVVRTILGGGPNVDNFQYSSTPYFTDVPPTYQFFKWIQKMRDLGITSGTTATTYGPQLSVTRGQMAVFIVRARLGTSTVFTYNPTPYFTDVPPDYLFYKWVQKLKEIGITSGTTATTYSPDDAVTRGEMAVFLIRAGFNTLLNPSLPLITSASPNHGAPGATASIAVTGLNTHFASDTTILADNGVTGNTPAVTDATHLTVTLNIPSGTPLGQISVTAETLSANEEATLPNGFIIGTGDPVPTISNISPASGPIGTAVTITGTTLVSSAGTPVSVLVPLQEGGLTGGPVTSATATSLTYVVPSTAATGKVTVSSASGSVTSTAAFTVVPSSTYTISAGPSSTNVIAGQTATYTVTASSSSGFTGLAQLSLSGLPAGVTGTFNPAQISVGEQSILTITAPANQTTNTASLVISASAVVDGIAVPAAATVTLNVTPITTSFLARTVVDDATNTSLVGVTVTMLGLDGSGHTTSCTGSTVSDASGNVALTNLPAACIGPQLIGFGGNSITSPAGKYAGVNVVFTLVANQVVVSPVLVHMPRTDNLETFYVKQNATADQSYSFKSIPGLAVTIYAGTVITAPDGTIPDPYPFSAVKIPLDRLPDALPPTTATVTAFLVSFPPANTTASKPIAVWFPNTLNTPPGTSMPLMTLNPTLGRVVPYGTGMVSNDGSTIVPDIDPSTGTLYHRFGISHFDWHGPSAPPAPGVTSGPPDGQKAWGADPVDLASGLFVMSDLDMDLRGAIPIRFKRTIRNGSSLGGPFGLGGDHSFDYQLDTGAPQSAALINLAIADQSVYPFTRQADGTLINTTIVAFQGAVMKTGTDGQVTLTWPGGGVMTFEPAGSTSVLTSWADRNGNALTFTRDTSYNLRAITDSAGRKLNFALDSLSRIVSITDSIGRSTSYTYEDGGHLATVTHPDGAKWSYTYDASGNLSTVTDPRSVVIVKNTFDGSGRVTRQVQSDGTAFTFAYTLINALVPTSPVEQTAITDQLGHTTTYRFNTDGYVVSVADALGGTTTLTRQIGTNNILSITGNAQCADVCGTSQTGNISFTYDSMGNYLTVTDASGDSESFQYAAGTNSPVSVTNALGQTYSFNYDNRNNMISATDENGGSNQYVYDTAGRVKQVIDEGGNRSALGYDAIGNLVSLTDAKGNISRFGYDAVSRLVSATDSLGETTTLQYDAKDRPVKQTNANGQVTRFTYDPVGNMATMTDPKGGVITYTYDVNEHLSSVKDQTGMTATYTYDAAGNLTSATDRRGLTTTYTYDVLNRRILDTFADGATVSRQFDAAGRIDNQTDSVAGVFTYAYDVNGSLSRMTTPFGSVSYTRDALLNVTARQVTGQPAVNYTYNSRGFVNGIAIGTNTVALNYDARNKLTGVTRSNGVTTANTFDAVGELATITHTDGGVTLDTESVSYDSLNNVAGASRVLALPLSTQSSTATYDAANHLTSFGSRTLTSDANGSRLTDVSPAGSTSYTWDARGRLTAMIIPGGFTVAYLYDPEGNLIRRRVTGTGTDTIDEYLVDETTNVIYQARQGGETLNMLTGLSYDQQFGVVGSAGTLGFALHDYLGSVVGNTDKNGNLAGQNNYEPFGETTQTGSALPFAYSGRLLVSPDLYNFRARYYDPSTGSFISEDPAGLASDFNFSRYAHDNPMSMQDPTGLLSGGWSGAGIAEAGTGTGASAQASFGMGFFNGTKTVKPSYGGFTASGGFYGGPGNGSNWDSARGATTANGSGNGGVAVGAVASVGAGLWLSNARKAKDLSGVFNQMNYNAGMGPLQVGVSIGWCGAKKKWGIPLPWTGTWIVGVSPPFLGLTAGIGASFYKTNTGWTHDTNNNDEQP